jgi:hypothetical protein
VNAGPDAAGAQLLGVHFASNSHFGFRGLAILASALRCRMNAAFRTRPERRIYAAGPQNENRWHFACLGSRS